MALHIDDSIKKYFMSRDGSLALASQNVGYINRYLNTVLGLDTPDVIESTNIDGEKLDFTKDNFGEAFNEENWGRLNFNEKAVVCNWLIDDMMEKADVEFEHRPELWFVADEKSRFKNMASYSRSLNRIYINPKSFGYSGVEILRATSHETQHAIDDRIICPENLSNTFINLFGTEVESNNIVSTLIDMDISQFPDVAEDGGYSKKDILLMKSLFSPIHPNLKMDTTIDEVYSFNEFKDYMILASYYASPMEVRAHKTSLKMVSENIENNADLGYGVFKDDVMFEKQSEVIIERCSHLSDVIGEDTTEFLDFAIRHNFYKLYGNQLPGCEGKFEELDKEMDEKISPYYSELLEDRLNDFEEDDLESEDSSDDVSSMNNM